MKLQIILRNTALVWTLLLCAYQGMGQDAGLLFYLSGSDGLKANYANGNPIPNYASNVNVISDGIKGEAIRCNLRPVLSYWAPANIYAQRGTLSFYWRSVEPFDATAFPIFRVGYADHSSWDMLWLRIDYNGEGFDAFVTDVNLARVRTSYKMPKLPAPSHWVHFALTWDENEGIRFYIDGQKVGQRDTTVVLNAGLDQFGPHARIISPYQVQSAYNYVRGGDFDELRIYDSALSDATIATLAKGNIPEVTPVKRDLSDKLWHDQWNLRYGWNRGGDLPPYLGDEATTVRKVQILEAYDLKRWWWKANDGIRETTWPGVYNRSRITGRNDYFQLPDWDCYSSSGKSIRFNLPDEPWNYLEVSGAADGRIALTPDKGGEGGQVIFTRDKGNERTFHKTATSVQGQTIVFTNNVQENPIGEFDAFYVHGGDAPRGVARLSYTLSTQGNYLNPNIKDIQQYIEGRYPDDQVTLMLGAPVMGGSRRAPARVATPVRPVVQEGKMPIVHVIIPSDFRSGMVDNALENNPMMRNMSYTWANMDGGLDGIRVTLPAMDVKAVENDLLPLNIQVKDPIWPLRNMMDFSLSVKPGEERVLWLDLRDRILPNDKPLYLSIAAGSADFNASLLEGAKIELVFKDREQAKAEHVADRLAQIQDNHAMIIEEKPNNRRLSKFTQIEADMTDLLRVDPSNKRGREYWYLYNLEQPRPQVVIPDAPQGVPAWAHLQLTLLKKFRHFVEWNIDNRQIEDGEFGGGLSDDSDFGNYFPALALMGVIPEKIDTSLDKMMQAIYNNGMLTNGMSTIETDGLHTYEEGGNVIGEMNLLRAGDPVYVSRLMEVAYGVKHYITGVNKAGHTHFRSDFFSATKMATGVWGWSFDWAGLHTIPVIYMGEFYGNKQARDLVVALADGYLAHATHTPDGKVVIRSEINFEKDVARTSAQGSTAPILWAAWKITGNAKYLKPLFDRGEDGLRAVTSNMLDQAGLREGFAKEIVRNITPDSGSDFGRHLAWQITGDKTYLEKYYADQIAFADVRQYVNTVGSIWIDRLAFQSDELQRSRMGGIASSRNQIYPGNTVSWKFRDGSTAQKVAILVPYSTQREFDIEFFNTDDKPVETQMTGGDVLGGVWQLTYGLDTDGDGKMDKVTSREKVDFGRFRSVTLTIPAREGVMVKMKLMGKGSLLNTCTDLAISKETVHIEGNRLIATIYNLGNTPSPLTQIALIDTNGQILTQVQIPAMEGSTDMKPRTAQVAVSLPQGVSIDGLRLQIDPQEKLPEILKTNNSVPLDEI